MSLRPAGAVLIALSELLGDADFFTFEDASSCVEPTSRMTRKLQDAGVETPFMDPGLRHDQKKYARVLRRLLAAGMLDYVPADDRRRSLSKWGLSR